MTLSEELDLLGYNGEVTVEMIERFRNEWNFHQRLERRDYNLAEAIKIMGLGSPLMIWIFCDSLGLPEKVICQLIFWLVALVGYVVVRLQMVKEGSEARGRWFMCQMLIAKFVGNKFNWNF